MKVVPSDESKRTGRKPVSMVAIFKLGMKMIRNVKCGAERGTSSRGACFLKQ